MLSQSQTRTSSKLNRHWLTHAHGQWTQLQLSRWELWQALEQGSVIDQARLEGLLKTQLPDLRKLLDYYKPPLGEFSKQLDGSEIEIDGKKEKFLHEQERAFLKRLATALNLNYVDCFKLVRRLNVMPEEEPKASVPGRRVDTASIYNEKLMYSVMDLYFKEREATVGLLYWLVRQYDGPSKALLLELHQNNTSGFITKLISQAESLLVRPLVSTMALKSPSASRFCLLEMISVLNLLICALKTAVLDFSAKEIVQLIEQISTKLIKPCKDLHKVFSGDNDILVASIQFRISACIFELLKIIDFTLKPIRFLQRKDDREIFTSSDAIKRIDQCLRKYDDASNSLTFLIWSAYLSKIHDQLIEQSAIHSYRDVFELLTQQNETADSIEIFKIYASKAFSFQTIQRVKDCIHAEKEVGIQYEGRCILQRTVAYTLTLFFTTFKLDIMPNSEEIVTCMAAALVGQPDTAFDLWNQTNCGSLSSFVEHALNVFPSDFSTLLTLLQPLQDSPQLANTVWALLGEMPFYVQDASSLTPNEAVVLEDKIVEALQDISIPEYPRFRIASGTRGSFFTQAGTSYIQWQMQYSFWDLALDILGTALCLQPKDVQQYDTHPDKTGLFCHQVFTLCKFISISGNAHSDEEYLESVQLSPQMHSDLIDVLTRLYSKLASFESVALELIAQIIDALSCLVVSNVQTWNLLKQANFTYSSPNLMLHDSSSACLTRIRTRAEARHGSYIVTSTFVRFVTKMLRKIRVLVYSKNYETFDVSLMESLCNFIVNDVATSFQNWRYKNNQELIRMEDSVLEFFVTLLEKPIVQFQNCPKHAIRDFLATTVHLVTLDSGLSRSQWILNVLSGCIQARDVAAYNRIEVTFKVIQQTLVCRSAFINQPSSVDNLLLQKLPQLNILLVELMGLFTALPWNPKVPVYASRAMALYAMMSASKASKYPLMATITPEVISGFCHRLDSSTALELRSALIYFGVAALDSHPAFGAVFGKDYPSHASFATTAAGIVKNSSQYFEEHAGILAIALAFFSKLWHCRLSQTEVIGRLRKEPAFWEGLRQIITKEKMNLSSLTYTTIEQRVCVSLTWLLLSEEALVQTEDSFKSSVSCSVLTEILKGDRFLALLDLNISDIPYRSTSEKLDILRTNSIDITVYQKLDWKTTLSNYPHLISPRYDEIGPLAADFHSLNLTWADCEAKIYRLRNFSNLLGILSYKHRKWCSSNLKDFDQILRKALEFSSRSDLADFTIGEEIRLHSLRTAYYAVQCMGDMTEGFMLALVDKIILILHSGSSRMSDGWLTYVMHVLKILLHRLKKCNAKLLNTSGLLTSLTLILCKVDLQPDSIETLILATIGCIGTGLTFIPEHTKVQCGEELVKHVLRLMQKSASDERFSYTLVSLIHLIRLFSSNQTLIPILMSEGLFQRFMALPVADLWRSGKCPDFAPNMPQRHPYHVSWCLILDVVSDLLANAPNFDDVVFGALDFVEHFGRALEKGFVIEWTDGSLTAARLIEIESTHMLFFYLMMTYSSWKRQRRNIAQAFIDRSLSIARQLSSLFAYPNRLAAVVGYIGESGTFETNEEWLETVQSRLFGILEMTLTTMNAWTSADAVFSLPSSEWDDDHLVLVPTLEISSRSSDPVSMGTFTQLLTVCKDQLQSSDVLQDPARLRQVVSVSEQAFALLISQLYYFLKISTTQDIRRSEMVGLEMGSDLGMLLDAYLSLFQSRKTLEKHAPTTHRFLLNIQSLLHRLS